MYNTEIHVRVHVALHIGLCRCLKYIKSDHGIISQHFSFVQTHPSVVALGKKTACRPPGMTRPENTGFCVRLRTDEKDITLKSSHVMGIDGNACENSFHFRNFNH